MLPVVGSEALAGGAAGPVVLAVNGMVEDARKEMVFFFSRSGSSEGALRMPPIR